MEGPAVADGQLLIKTSLEQLLVIVGLEIIRLVSVAVKESRMAEIQPLRVGGPIRGHCFNLVFLRLGQVKEHIPPVGRLIPPPIWHLGGLLAERGSADEGKWEGKIIGAAEIVRQGFRDLRLPVFAVKNEVATIDIGDRVLEPQLRQIGLEISHDYLVLAANVNAAEQ